MNLFQNLAALCRLITKDYLNGAPNLHNDFQFKSHQHNFKSFISFPDTEERALDLSSFKTFKIGVGTINSII